MFSYAFIIERFTCKCMILFRNIELPSLAQSVERYFYIIRNRQYIALYYQIMSLKQSNYLIIMLSFTLNFITKNKNVPLIGLELETSRPAGEHLNHYTTEYTRKSRNTIHKCRFIDFNEFSNLE